MNFDDDQQPIRRTVGRRRCRQGAPLTPHDRAAMSLLARYRTKAPKGIFIHYSAEQMNAARDQWTVDAILARQR